jgi:hypothetical protein
MFTREGAFRSSRGPIRFAISVILIHLAVSLVHGLMHSRLEIGLNVTQKIFVLLVITIAPLMAGYLLSKDKLRSGGALLASSMAVAFVFGIFYHFIAPGADNVNHQLPLGLTNWTRLFDETAVGIAGLEIIGITLGILLVLKSGGKAIKV